MRGVKSFGTFRGLRESSLARAGSAWNNAAGNAGVFALNVNNTLGNSNTNYGAAPAKPVQCRFPFGIVSTIFFITRKFLSFPREARNSSPRNRLVRTAC